VPIVLFPDSGKLTSLLVVTRETVDAGLDQDETVLGVLVLAVTLKMLADRDGLLDEEVQVLRDGRSKT
jgi:hypothetical protein